MLYFKNLLMYQISLLFLKWYLILAVFFSILTLSPFSMYLIFPFQSIPIHNHLFYLSMFYHNLCNDICLYPLVLTLYLTSEVLWIVYCIVIILIFQSSQAIPVKEPHRLTADLHLPVPPDSVLHSPSQLCSRTLAVAFPDSISNGSHRSSPHNPFFPLVALSKLPDPAITPG